MSDGGEWRAWAACFRRTESVYCGLGRTRWPRRCRVLLALILTPDAQHGSVAERRFDRRLQALANEYYRGHGACAYPILGGACSNARLQVSTFSQRNVEGQAVPVYNEHAGENTTEQRVQSWFDTDENFDRVVELAH